MGSSSPCLLPSPINQPRHMVLLSELLTLVTEQPGLESLHLHQIQQFLNLLYALSEQVHDDNWARRRESPILSPRIIAFIASTLNLTPDQVSLCWSCLQEFIQPGGTPPPFHITPHGCEDDFTEHNLRMFLLNLFHTSILLLLCYSSGASDVTPKHVVMPEFDM